MIIRLFSFSKLFNKKFYSVAFLFLFIIGI
nr:MAG TPA: hypothetical protein [Caudoviricetes sp.]